MDICQRVTRVVSPRRLGGGLVGPHLRGGRYPGDSSVPLCHVVLAGRFGDSPLPNPFLRWVGRAASPRRPLFPMGAQFCLPCRSRRAARRSAPTESVLCDGLVGPTSPRRPLSRWELSSSCHVVLGGRLGDPPLPNPFCAMSW